MKNRGFTLIELAVVLAIIAVLAAILTPIVTNYLEQARVTRATADVRTIADSIRLYQRDVGFYPVYSSLTNARTGVIEDSILQSTGNDPDESQADWTALVGTSVKGDIITKLNNAFAGMSTGTNSNIGRAGFRGPYVGALDTDPWGNRYIVTAANLGGTTNRGFVVSAGPNGKLETVVAQGTAAFAAGGDDIALPIN